MLCGLLAVVVLNLAGVCNAVAQNRRKWQPKNDDEDNKDEGKNNDDNDSADGAGNDIDDHHDVDGNTSVYEKDNDDGNAGKDDTDNVDIDGQDDTDSNDVDEGCGDTETRNPFCEFAAKFQKKHLFKCKTWVGPTFRL